MAGIEASMTLGGVADDGTYRLARGLRQARSDTIGVVTYSSWRQPGCEARFPIAVCMSCPGVLNHDRGVADAPRYARNRPYSIRGSRRHPIRLPALRSAWWRSLLLLGYFTANLDRWDPKVTNG